MRLILTHEKSDFDAVASQLAAHKLFPDGAPLLARHVNRNVQQFLNLYWDALPFIQARDWRRQQVTAVILVDTQNINHVRGMKKKLQVQVFDHHVGQMPPSDWTSQIEPVGATTTILIERLQTFGLILSSIEATLLLLGIYEDTGSLTYDTTTGRDIRAAAWALEQGAQLDIVRRFMTVPLSPAQRNLFDDLQANAEWLTIHEQEIVLATAVARPGFDDEISAIVHRLRDTMNPAGLFVLVQLGQDVQFVARSTEDTIDVGEIATALGGGGHSRASAAIMIRKTLADARAETMALLPKLITPPVRVAEIMSHGVQTLAPETIVTKAAQMMQRSGHEGYPVIHSKDLRIVGLLTRRAVDRAMSHNLTDIPISRIMRSGGVAVRPSDSILHVQTLMLEEGWGQIPVVAEDSPRNSAPRAPIGVVTRTDLLNHFSRPQKETGVLDVRRLLQDSVPAPVWQMILAIGAVADELKMPLFFVGGLVRDMLLGKTAVDLDMVVEGDAIALAKKLNRRFGGDVHTHARFGTAKWSLSPEIWHAICREDFSDGDGLPLPASVDFVTARTEFYRQPSALPEVSQGSIKLDLHRRDFTINTLAMRLDGAHLGELLDFYSGRRDLERGLIRVLHSLSFIDDPTRILRAVRLEQRLGFQIESRTAELLADSLPMLARVTGGRIRHEIELALSEADPMKVMERLDELGVMEQIHPDLSWTPAAVAAYQRAELAFSQVAQSSETAVALPDKAFLYFALWLAPLPQEVQRSVTERLQVRKNTRDDVLGLGCLLHELPALPTDSPPSVVTRALRPFSQRVLAAARIYIEEPHLLAWLDQFEQEWQHVKNALTGDDFRTMGLKPGPLYRVWLDRLLAARLDGQVSNEAQERALLKRLIDTTELGD